MAISREPRGIIDPLLVSKRTKTNSEQILKQITEKILKRISKIKNKKIQNKIQKQKILAKFKTKSEQIHQQKFLNFQQNWVSWISL